LLGLEDKTTGGTERKNKKTTSPGDGFEVFLRGGGGAKGRGGGLNRAEGEKNRKKRVMGVASSKRLQPQ